mgnify:CR=1 FL=1
MDDVTFQNKINELVKEIGSIPTSDKKKFITLVRKTRESHEEMKKRVANAQDSLDYLRLSVKYLLFDLEATRRENKYLKKLLDDRKN